MIFTSTRFRRCPSRLTGQPFRLALKDLLPGAKDFGELGEAVEPAVGHRDHHGFAWRPITCRGNGIHTILPNEKRAAADLLH